MGVRFNNRNVENLLRLERIEELGYDSAIPRFRYRKDQIFYHLMRGSWLLYRPDFVPFLLRKPVISPYVNVRPIANCP
jgi:hypothetical protein